MLDFSRIRNYYILNGYTDMHKQIDSLAALIELAYGRELTGESLYLFCGRKSDRGKALYWDSTEHVLLTKRLTERRFQWPRSPEALKQLTKQEFRWLVEGLALEQTKAIKPGKPGNVC